MILVVWGHVVSQATVDVEGLAAAFASQTTVIYSFHMYAFFFVAGFVSLGALSLQGTKERGLYIWKKAKRLLVPYFIMGLLYVPAKALFPQLVRVESDASDVWRMVLGENPDGALWFLYVLFLFHLILALTARQQSVTAWLAVAAGLIAIYKYGPGALVTRMVDFLPFFLLGLLVGYLYSREVLFKALDSALINIVIGAVALVVFAMLNARLLRGELALENVYASYALDFAVALAGTVALLALSTLLSKGKGAILGLPARLLDGVGTYGMDIYIFSEPIKVVVRELLVSVPPLAAAVACFLAAFGGAMLLSRFVVRRVKVLRVMFLGME